MGKSLFFLATACFCWSPGYASGPDTLAVTVVRQSHHEWTGVSYKPYAVWWVEDRSGNLVKILYITHYDDSNPGTTIKCGKPGYLSSLSYYWSRFTESDGCPDRPGEQCQTCPVCPGDFRMPVDGITGCSEYSSTSDTTSVTRMWDLTDRDGNRVADGIYDIYYSAVFLDEQVPQADKTYKVSVVIDSTGYDSVYTVLNEVSGHTADNGYSVQSIALSFGGSSGTGSNGGPAAGYIPNLPPPAPTAPRPREPGFCGSGAVLLAGVAIIGLKSVRRREKCGFVR